MSVHGKAEDRGRVATTPEKVARAFHEAYERLAPDFGYSTREASAKPWADVPRQNRDLMCAVVEELLAEMVVPAERAEEWRERAESEEEASRVLTVMYAAAERRAERAEAVAEKLAAVIRAVRPLLGMAIPGAKRCAATMAEEALAEFDRLSAEEERA